MNESANIVDLQDMDITPLKINFVSGGINDKKFTSYPGRAEFGPANFNLYFCIILAILFLIFILMLLSQIYIMEFSLQLFLVLFTGWGSFSFGVGHHLMKKYSTKVVFDMKSSTIVISQNNGLKNLLRQISPQLSTSINSSETNTDTGNSRNPITTKLPMNELQCVQICYWKFPNSHRHAYQLNLCFIGNKRFNIMSRNLKSQVVKIGQQIAHYANVDLIDCVEINRKS